MRLLPISLKVAIALLLGCLSFGCFLSNPFGYGRQRISSAGECQGMKSGMSLQQAYEIVKKHGPPLSIYRVGDTLRVSRDEDGAACVIYLDDQDQEIKSTAISGSPIRY